MFDKAYVHLPTERSAAPILQKQIRYGKPLSSMSDLIWSYFAC